MTGQVKEDVLSRFTELGVRIEAGSLRFDPVLFEPDEFLDEPADFTFENLNNQTETQVLYPGQFGFTFCQTPIIYQQSDEKQLLIHWNDKQPTRRAKLQLTYDETQELFVRNGSIEKIEVFFPAKSTQ